MGTLSLISGEYALYGNGKVAALVCDDQVFVKLTAAGRAYVDDCVEAPVCPGGKALLADR